MDVWKDTRYHRQLFDHVKKKMNLMRWEDWYHVRRSELESFGIHPSVWSCYGNSHMVAIASVYSSDFKWKMWRFDNVPDHYWEDSANVRRFLDDARLELGIRELDDWYTVSTQQLANLGGRSVISLHGGLEQFITSSYPDHRWISRKFHEKVYPSKRQHELFGLISRLLPHHDILMDHPHPHLSYDHSDRHIELDIFIPSLSLAFEHHGEQHYQSQDFISKQLQERMVKDRERRMKCDMAGITLIEIPYWVQLKSEDIQATIHRVRPDIIQDKGCGNPIDSHRTRMIGSDAINHR